MDKKISRLNNAYAKYKQLQHICNNGSDPTPNKNETLNFQVISKNLPFTYTEELSLQLWLDLKNSMISLKCFIFSNREFYCLGNEGILTFERPTSFLSKLYNLFTFSQYILVEERWL